MAQMAAAETELARLLKRMPGRRSTLMGIVRFCAQEPRDAAAVEAKVEELQAASRSVYAAPTLCGLLERAGGLVRVGENSDPLDPEAAADAAEPAVVEVDGVECFEPAAAPAVRWLATEEGRALVEADDPEARLWALVEDEPLYGPVYERVLELCAAEEGATTAALSAAIDNDPLLQEPRCYVQMFVDRLEGCGAVAWRGGWCTTELGLRVLDAMARGE